MNTQVDTSGAVDRRADWMQPFFGGSIGSTTGLDTESDTLDDSLSKTSAAWYATVVDQTVGSTPGSFTVLITCDDSVDEQAFDTVLNPDGPIADLPIGTACSVKKMFYDSTGEVQSELLMVGEVMGHNHVIYEGHQAIEVKVIDARHRLKDVRVIGRYMQVPGKPGAVSVVYYQHGWSSRWNPDGRPNCVFTKGGIPVFAPYPDYGLDQDQEPPDASQRLEDTACYWTLENIIEYLQAFWGSTTPQEIAAVVSAALAMFSELQLLPGWVNWPAGFAAGLDSVAQNNFNNAVGQNNTSIGGARKGRDIKAIHGMSLLGDPQTGDMGVLDMIFQAAGGWSWTLQYSEDLGASTTIIAVPTRWTSPENGVDMPFGMGDPNSFGLSTITGGNYSVSAESTITRATGHGSLVKIETRVGTDDDSLVQAWNGDDETAMKQLAVSLGGGTATVETVQQAFDQYWWVGTTYTINPAFDFQEGTDQSDNTRAPITRPIWPMLLSFQGNRLTAGDILPWPVRAECSVSGTFVTGMEADGLEVWDDGIIYMPGLRAIKLQGDGTGAGTFTWNSVGGTISGGIPIAGSGATAMIDISFNYVRVSLAIPCDHRLNYTSDVAIGLTSPDADQFTSDFSRGVVLDLNGMYELWLRMDSWPIPEGSGADAAADDLPTTDNAVRSDLELLQGHVDRALVDNYALDKSASVIEFKDIVTGYAIGTAVNNLAPVGDGVPAGRRPYPVRARVGGRRFISSPSKDEQGAIIFDNRTQHFFPVR